MSDPHDFGPLGACSEAADRAVGAETDLDAVRLAVLLEIACDAIVAVDRDGLIVLINASAEQMFGFAREELIGRPAEVLVPSHARKSHVLDRVVYLEDPQPRRLEVTAARRDGSEFPVEITLNTLATAGGFLVVAAVRDIAERKRVEARSERLAAIVGRSHEAIIAVSLDGLVTDWSAGAQRMYGYSAADAVGRHVGMLCPSGEQEHELERILESLAAGEEIDNFETQRRRKDGAVIDVSVTISPIRNARGDVAGASTVARDIGERKRSAAALTDAEERFRGAFEEAPIGMVMLTPRLLVSRVNAAMCRLLGRTADEVVGCSILEFTHAEDVRRSLEWNYSRSGGDTIAPLIKRYVRADGSIVEAQVTTALIEPHGSERYFFSQCEDVTARRRGERQRAVIANLGRMALEYGDVVALMREAVRMVREILATTNCIVARCSVGGEVRMVAGDGDTPGFTLGPEHPTQTAQTLELSQPLLSNDLAREKRFPVPRIVLERGLRRGLSVPEPERSDARHVILAHGTASMPALTTEDVQFVQAVADVLAGALDRSATENELRRRALEDPLTGLANRTLFSSQLDAELRHARRLGNRVCVLVLDLDRFKTVNDTLGHSAGDALLSQVAARLTGCVREEDLVARPGGDEFTILCSRTASDHAVAELAERLIDAVIEPFDLGGREVFLTVSVGVAVSEHGSGTPEELLRDADTAMYRAKERGGNRFEIFDLVLREHLIARMSIESELRHALERDQLELHYQPLIDLSDERVVGFEALLRWRHPDRGLIAPDQFIQIAEETGLIIPMGSWVINRVCAQLASWPEQIHASANLSALQITPQLVPEVARGLARHHLTPRRLVLEITESLVLDPAIKSVVSSLRALGVQLALDDFGSGYSSLGSLQRFPLDVLKLDRTLTDSLGESSGVAVVHAAVELGRALGVDVIAEGIETKTQLDVLRELRCPLGQGYLFAKPLPLAEAQSRIVDAARPPA